MISSPTVNQIRIEATGSPPSTVGSLTQCPAVRNRLSLSREPVQRQSGSPSSSTATISPTHGYTFSESGSPNFTAFAGDAATPATATETSRVRKTSSLFTFYPFNHGNGQGRLLHHELKET